MSAQVAADLRAAADAVQRRDFLDVALRGDIAREVIEPLITGEPLPADEEIIAALRAAADRAESQS